MEIFKLTKEKFKYLKYIVIFIILFILINFIYSIFFLRADCCPGKPPTLPDNILKIISLGIFPIEYGFLSKIYYLIGETIWRGRIFIEWPLEIIYLYFLTIIFELINKKYKFNFWFNFLILFIIIFVIGLINFIWQIFGANPSIII